MLSVILNVRDVPDSIVKRLRIIALKNESTLKDNVIAALVSWADTHENIEQIESKQRFESAMGNNCLEAEFVTERKIVREDFDQT